VLSGSTRVGEEFVGSISAIMLLAALDIYEHNMDAIAQIKLSSKGEA